MVTFVFLVAELHNTHFCSFLLQGITMKPLVTWLNVKKASISERTLIEKVQNKVMLQIKVRQQQQTTIVMSTWYSLSPLID